MDTSIIKNASEISENKEWDLIDGILPSLLKKKGLTDIEGRIITSTKTLSDRKCAIYDMIMSKTDQETSELISVLRTSTQALRAKANSTFQNRNCNQEKNDPTSPLTTVLLNETVMENLHEFLRLEDIKNCRLVCRQWTSTAEKCLQKRCLIHFRANVFQPSTFLDNFKYSLPNLPYKAFKFSSTDLPWTVAEIQEFFDKNGKNIKDMRLEGIILTDRKDSEVFLPSYDVSPWFTNCSNMTMLKITTHKNNKATPLHISLDQLASVKSVILRKCRIIIDAENENTRIAPKSISLTDVSINRGGIVLEDYRYDDFINLSQTKFARLLSTDDRINRRYPELDMQSQVFNTNRLYLVNVQIENWTEAKGDVGLLRLYGFDFLKKSQLKIKKLAVLGEHVVDLSALPHTVEKLKLLQNNQIICSSEPIELPNIKYLLFDIVDNNSHLLTHFTKCSNLTELELDGSEQPKNLYLICIPRTVRKLKLNCVHIKIVDHYILELETLILDDKKHISKYSDFANILTKIKTKNLVVVVTKKTQLPAADIMKLVESNSNNPKTFSIGSSSDVELLKEADFEGSEFSECVDRKSNYYLFENKVGKAIPQAKFDLSKTLDNIKKLTSSVFSECNCLFLIFPLIT